MQPDVDLITELWARLKPFVPQKERLDVADAIVAVFDEHGYADGLEEAVDTLDRPLGAAVKSLYGVDEYEEDEDDDYDY
jgi:hypothetical protein